MMMKAGDPGRHTIKHECHYCLMCQRSMTVNIDGTFRAHNLPRGGVRCVNSGRAWNAQMGPEQVAAPKAQPSPSPKRKPVVDLGRGRRRP